MARVFSVVVIVALIGAFSLHSQTPDETLRSYYVSRFISQTSEVSPSSWLIDRNKTKISILSLLDKKDAKETKLNDFDMRDYLVRAYAPHFQALTLITNADLAYHLQVFGAGDEAHLYEVLFKSQTIFGEVFGAYMLASGATENIAELKERQAMLHVLLENSAMRNAMRKGVKDVQAVQGSLLDLFHPRGISSSPYLSASLKKKGEGALKATDDAVQARLSKVNSGYAWPLLTNPLRLPNVLLSNYLTLGFIGFGLLEAKAILSGIFTCGPFSCGGCIKGGCIRGGKLLLGSLSAAMQGYFAYQFYIDHTQLATLNAILNDRLGALKMLLDALVAVDGISGLPQKLQVAVSAKQISDIEYLRNALATLNEQNDSHLFQANLARAYVVLELFEKVRPELEKLLVQMGKIDFYVAVADALEQNKGPLTFVNFSESQTPLFEAQGLINPLLYAKNAQPNVVSVGTAKPSTVVLTGPNASGKSTLLRAVATNVIHLAQTLGLATAHQLTLTPVHALHGFLESRDFSGKSSSYESDIDRIIGVVKVHRGLEPHQKAMLIVDEILSSTNAKEALIGSKEILKELAKSTQGMTLVSTHLYGLGELGESDAPLFHNQHMELLREGTRVKLTYRLVEGVSNDTNALDIVSQEFAEFIEGQIK